MEGGSPLRSRLGNRPAWTTLQCSVGRLGPSGWSKEGKDGGWKPAALGAGESSSMDDSGRSKEGKDGGGKPAALAAGESSSMDDTTM
jgi:hypothetical protein